MALQAAFVLGYGVEHACDTVGNVVLYHVAHIQRHEHNAHGRQQKVEVVGLVDADVDGEDAADGVYEPLEHHGRKACEDAHEERQHEHEVFFLDMALAPLYEAHQGGVESARERRAAGFGTEFLIVVAQAVVGALWLLLMSVGHDCRVCG